MSASTEVATSIAGVAHRRRVVLGVLTVLAIVGAIALGAVLGPPGGGRLLDLELASSAAEFRAALASWRQPVDTEKCGIGSSNDAQGGSVIRLQCNLFVDSVVFVPGYVGLLVLFLVVLGPAAWPRRRTAIQFLCVLPVAAGFFDIAENGMTARAAADELERLLADGTVLDVRNASLIKWALVAASFGLVACAAGFAAFSTSWMPRVPRTLLRVGALLAAITALLLAIGVGLSERWLLFGSYAAPAALLALVGWQATVLRSRGVPS